MKQSDRPKVYLAGPMRGIINNNFPAFDAAKITWEVNGWYVVSPADLDRKYGDGGAKPGTPASYRVYVERDMKELLSLRPERGDGIAMLKGWQDSVGAQAEYRVARWLGLAVYDAHSLHEIPVDLAPKTDQPQSKEVMSTARTGGQKGVKPERYDLIPWDAMDEVARVYFYGADKYDDRNWENGYEWGKSISALFRHARAFTMGESRDPDSGKFRTHHLGSVVFHALSLIRWEKTHPELDDRSTMGRVIV